MFSKTAKKKEVELGQYSAVIDDSSHGKAGLFTIEDDDVEASVSPQEPTLDAVTLSHQPADLSQSSLSLSSVWSTLAFVWLQDLLTLGNQKPLTLEDLYPLPQKDQSAAIYAGFKQAWQEQLRKSASPSLAWSFASSYGRPFLAAGLLKLVHDSCLFLGPLLLNSIISFLSHPEQPLVYGLYCVAGLFFSNLLMSLCLRQYFFTCYRVGMNLRSAVVTSVYHKSLVLNTSVLSRKTTGEISNLMSVDSSRLQELTPYLHALWYSFFQIILALVFLYRQLGLACLAGMAVIIIAIPVTSKISGYMKTLQKALSKIRDERVKLTNEVLSGMKVIKLQAWEKEFQERIQAIRQEELRIFTKYTLTQAYSGTLYTCIPLVVAIVTFSVYVYAGGELSVGRALTSLALFDLLRFPLFMLPMVINNVVEARVSLDRVQSYLLEQEHQEVGRLPLRGRAVEGTEGVLMYHASLVHDGVLEKKLGDGEKGAAKSSAATPSSGAANGTVSTYDKLKRLVETFVHNTMFSQKTATVEDGVGGGREDKKQVLIKNALLQSAEQTIENLTAELSRHTCISKNHNVDDGYVELLVGKKDESGDEQSGPGLLTLHRVTFQASKGQLVCVVGTVGCGKSSLINSLLGNLRLCSGVVGVTGRIAYTSQLPYIMNNTLKNNILFGQPFEEERYLYTLRVCALLPDLEVLPAGDETEIGERGINLSGGQKARVSLARAVYSDADIFMLDDPLSAVDAHVGAHIFTQCICDLRAQNKCVLLVTNALQYVRSSDYVMVLRGGEVVEQGTYQDLMKGCDRGGSITNGASSGVLVEMMAAMKDTMSNNVIEESGLGGEEVEGLAEEAKEGEGRARKPSTTETKVLLSSTPPKEGGGKLITTEEKGVGDVGWKVYYAWCVAAGGGVIGGVIVGNYYLGEFITVLTSYWLSVWASSGSDDTVFYLSIYILINLGICFATLWKEYFSRMRALHASRILFTDLLRAVLYAPMSFFDTTPLGRVINRFSKDIYTIDEQIPQTVRSYLSTMAKVTGVLLYIVIITPLFLVALLPIGGFYVMAQKYYIKTSRELTRIENISRSPIYALFSETLEGLATIRAYNIEHTLIKKNNNLLDNNQRAYFLNFAANCWLAVRLEFAGTLIVSFAALCAVMGRDYYLHSNPTHDHRTYAALAGLAISLALSVTQSLNWTVRMASDMESQMVSVERVKEYAEMPGEAPHYLPADPTLSNALSRSTTSMLHSQTWPKDGKVEFRNVALRYRSNLPKVLDGVNFVLNPREKVGVVGRTGAGKSSLVTALLRLVELEEGSIFIDNLDISTLGLHVLRSAITIIPQDPVLFSGSIRSNLDPFGKYSDEQINNVLSNCQLRQCITSLEDKVQENGCNFSVGQRQLLCIARALLVNSKIIVMDEATAAVDVETDALIQQVIRTQFATSTCLTIAHRLNTILDSDVVIVMDKGGVGEMGPPQALMQREGGLFSELVKNWEKSG